MSKYLEKPSHARADWTVSQEWSAYSSENHKIWDRLYDRMIKVLPDRAAPEFHRGLEALDLHRGGIPNFEILSDELEALTGWRIVAVPGLVPDDDFSCFLKARV